MIATGKGKDLPPVDAPISTVAAVILEQAKAEYPNDKVLDAVKLDAHITWTTLLAAMETIHRALPPSWARARQSHCAFLITSRLSTS